MGEVRYSLLQQYPEQAEELFEKTAQDAKERWKTTNDWPRTMPRQQLPKPSMQLLSQEACVLYQTTDKGRITAEAVLLSTDCEIVARIAAAADTFIIEQAVWELLRQGG